MWQDRVPARMREAAPRILEIDGKHQWSYDGAIYPTIGLNAVAGKGSAGLGDGSGAL